MAVKSTQGQGYCALIVPILVLGKTFFGLRTLRIPQLFFSFFFFFILWISFCAKSEVIIQTAVIRSLTQSCASSMRTPNEFTA